MPKETKADRERARADALATVKDAQKKATERLLKTTIPFDGGRAIGDLTRAEALEYSQRLVALAHLINGLIPKLPEARVLRRKSEMSPALRGQHTQHLAHAGFIDEDEDRNPSGVARRR